ncbi:Succinate dehydrogenase cytochrome b subunit [hydrothermal vent metagenome]|uniref:Succinate dehydrogenase cytochrome b subunit n=1 Tax=hydrothermal vent metagenome TaxID=652676 RepID=A0A1W1E5B1_9ZZZZ
MSFVGLTWFFYVIYHVLSLQNFHKGQAVFNNFYIQMNQWSIYHIATILLVLLLLFHVITAISRQLSNNISKGQAYKKPYPYGIPRIVAWSNAILLLIFIVFHFVQMKILINGNLYQQLSELLIQPLMFGIYLLGIITLSAHLHHALTNVLQTLGISSKTYNVLVVLLVFLLFIGFISIPVSVML